MQTRLAFVLAAMLSITMLQGQNKMTPIQQTVSANLAKGELAWTHLGQQGFLLKFGKTIITIDAYLTPSKGRNIQPASCNPRTSRQSNSYWERIANHSDHIDKPTWKKIADLHSHVKFVIPADVLDGGQRPSTASQRSVRRIGRWAIRYPWRTSRSRESVYAAHEYLDRGNPITGQFPCGIRGREQRNTHLPRRAHASTRDSHKSSANSPLRPD